MVLAGLQFVYSWVALCVFISKVRPWQGKNGQMINDQGEGSVGGTLQHHALNTSRQVMLPALHSLNHAFIPENTSLALQRWSSHSPLCLRLRGDDRQQWGRTLTRHGEWCHRSEPRSPPRRDDCVKLHTFPQLKWASGNFTDKNSTWASSPAFISKKDFSKKDSGDLAKSGVPAAH